MNRIKPPKYPLRFFHWFCNPEFVEDIEGDLLERFEKRPCKWRFTLEVLRLLRPSITKPINIKKLNSYGMFKHYYISTFRSFRKETSYAFINFLGLTISMGVGLITWQYISNEKAVDSYHHNSFNKYRINYGYYENKELITKSATTTFGLGYEVKENLAGIKNMVRVRPVFSDEGLVISSVNNSKKFLEFSAYYVEDTFLDFFNYPIVQGNRINPLSESNQIVLTAHTSKKFFGNENPIGKQLKINGGNLSGDFIVSAVLEEPPAGSHFDFDYLISIDFLLSHYGVYQREDGWRWENFYTYFELENKIQIERLTVRIDELIYSNIGHSLDAMNQEIKTSFQPISNIYLDPFIDGDSGLNKGSLSSLNTFLAIGVVILIVACINYINLASARAIQKKQQISVKKAIGASKAQIIFQFLSESFFFNLISFGVALLLSSLIIAPLNSMLNTSMNLSILSEPIFWTTSIGIIVSLSILTGLYPGLLSLKLEEFFKKSTQSTFRNSGLALKRSLLGFQLMASIVFVAGTWLVYSQLDFMKSKELGVDMDQLFVFQGPRVGISDGHDVMKVKRERFKKSLLSNPSIQSVTATSNVPGTGEIWYGGVRKLGDTRDKEVETEAIFVDKDFTDAYDLELLAGATFHEGMRDYEAVIINEAALYSLGLNQPLDALGYSVVLEDIDTLKIQAVVKDIHWNSLHETVPPTIFGIVDYAAFFTLRVNTKNLPETVEFIQNTFNKHYPKDPYISFFLDDEFNLQYESEQQFGQIFSTLAFMAIIISSMGLFSLIAFSLSQKMKEIGIRKVLGASGQHLFRILSKEYFLIFAVALIVSTPIIFIGADKWLSDFAYRISTGIELLVLPSLLVAIVTFIMVAGKTLKAIQTNPVDQLRDE